uniref:Host-nuclease inhibitor protein Gam n=1 Tax=Knipowitschia caucasica TaxID=637954 RepID=A0AAV2K584_KNICA
MKTQLDALNANINQKLEAATSQIEDATRRLEEVERKAAGAETWDLAVRDTLLDLINNQRDLQSKMSDLEGRSRLNKIRTYGIAVKTEGTSTAAFIESFILNELRESIGIQRGADLGIERAH